MELSSRHGPRRGSETRLAVSTTTAMKNALLDALDDASRARLPREAAVALPSSQGWCAGLIALVRGQVDCFFAECCQVWDHAPWILLVEEAGGRFTNPRAGAAARWVAASTPTLVSTVSFLWRPPR